MQSRNEEFCFSLNTTAGNILASITHHTSSYSIAALFEEVWRFTNVSRSFRFDLGKGFEIITCRKALTLSSRIGAGWSRVLLWLTCCASILTQSLQEGGEPAVENVTLGSTSGTTLCWYSFQILLFTLTNIEVRGISPVWSISSILKTEGSFFAWNWLSLRKTNSARSTSSARTYARRILVAVTRCDFLLFTNAGSSQSRPARASMHRHIELRQVHQQAPHLLPTSVTSKNQTSKSKTLSCLRPHAIPAASYRIKWVHSINMGHRRSRSQMIGHRFHSSHHLTTHATR